MLQIIRELLLLLVRQPFSFFLQLWETAEAWLSSRRWKEISLYLVPLLVLSILPAIVFRGLMKKQQELVIWYANAFQTAVDLEKGNKSATEAAANFNPLKDGNSVQGLSLAEITSRRLLQLQPGNERARFYVADGMRQKGLTLYARQMMIELAPENKVGYSRAHAWIVNDLIESAQKKGGGISPQQLQHHIQAACLTNEVEPQMLVLHASLLENLGKHEEALKELERAAGKDPQHWLDVARFARKYKKGELTISAGRNALKHFSDKLAKVDTPQAQIENVEMVRVQMAMAHAFMNDHEKAIEVLKNGLRTGKPCVILREALSNAYLYRYQSNLEKFGDPVKVGLEDLEQAMSWNPANTQVADLVSQLMAFQGENRERIGQMLRRQIIDGRGVAVTHVLLANESILVGNIDAALPHLEIAYLHFPNALNVLNNLALCLATATKPDLARAEELINKAIKIGGESEELMDSRGQILALAGKDLEAIRSFEKAIALAPKRIRTRERLVGLYAKVGMQDMIAPQQKAIDEIRRQIQLGELRRQEQAERARIANEFARNRLPLFCDYPEMGEPPSPAN